MADTVKPEEMRELEQRIDYLEAEIRKWMDENGWMFRHMSAYHLDRSRPANYKRGRYFVAKRNEVS